MVAVLPGKIGVPIFSILKAQAKPKHVVFLEGDNEKIQRACHSILEEAFGSRALSNPFSFSGDCAQSLGSIQGLVPTKNSPGFAAGDHYVLHTLNRFHVLRALESGWVRAANLAHAAFHLLNRVVFMFLHPQQ